MVTYEREGAVAVVSIDRPDAKHAVDAETARQLRDAWDRFASGEGRGGEGVDDTDSGA